MDERRPAGIPVPLLFFFALAFILLHIGSYGLTFAEARVIEDARRFLAWIIGSASTDEVWFGAERPSPAKILAAVGILLGGSSPVAIRVLPAALYAFAVSAMYGAVRRPRGAVAAYAVAAGLLVAPPFIALSAQCSNESVVTSLSMLALALAATARDRRAWTRVGLLAGFACGTKISGLIVLAGLPLWAALERPRRQTGSDLAYYLLAACLGFLLTWPVLPLRPTAFIEHIRTFATLERPEMLFFGPVAQPPWYYAPLWIAIGLPPLLLAASLHEFTRGSGPFIRLLRVIAGIGVFAAIASHAVLREGLRHLLPFIALIAVAGGLGAGRLEEKFGPRGRYVRGVYLLALIVPTVLIHPAESMYVNLLAGGPSGAVRVGLPVTASGDLLTRDVLSRLGGGTYAVIAGPACDHPHEFTSRAWRDEEGRIASKIARRPIKFTNADVAEQLIILGASRFDGFHLAGIGRPLMERSGVVYVSEMKNPLFKANSLSER